MESFLKILQTIFLSTKNPSAELFLIQELLYKSSQNKINGLSFILGQVALISWLLIWVYVMISAF